MKRIASLLGALLLSAVFVKPIARANVEPVLNRHCQDCNFCIDGWHYVQADAWAYFDPITEYTNHYIEACSATGCYHECTAFRDKVTQTVLLITDCFIMAGSCSGCQ